MDGALSRFDDVVVTDSKNVYDSVNRIESSGLQLEERRLALEVLSIRERTKAAGITLRWVDSDQQLADNLSKPFCYLNLLTAIEKGQVCLQFDDSFTSAKQKRAWQHSRGIAKGRSETPTEGSHQKKVSTDVKCTAVTDVT